MKVYLDSSEREKLQLLQRSVKERWSYVRITCVLMLSDGFSVEQVCQILGIDDNTVYRYGKDYLTLPLERFLDRHYAGYSGKLNCMELGALFVEVETHLYTTAEQVCEWVLDTFDVRYSPAGMAKLLQRIGFSYKKTKQVPCEANFEKQQVFLNELDELLFEPETVVYYLDAVHPTHNTRSLHAWTPKGQNHELPTVSGRDRININGAVNAHQPSQVIVQTGDTINAQNTKSLYEKLLEANPNKKAIYVIADNARYYRNKELKEWVAQTKIVQVFLPPYSPNLNLIERLWKFMRKKAIDPIFYRTKEEFRAGILAFFENIAQYQDELNRLLTLNFRVINSQFNF